MSSCKNSKKLGLESTFGTNEIEKYEFDNVMLNEKMQIQI